MAGSIFCDLERTLDPVIMIYQSKLPYFRTSGKAKLLLPSYIRSKHQRVKITKSYITSNTSQNGPK